MTAAVRSKCRGLLDAGVRQHEQPQRAVHEHRPDEGVHEQAAALYLCQRQEQSSLTLAGLRKLPPNACSVTSTSMFVGRMKEPTHASAAAAPAKIGG